MSNRRKLQAPSGGRYRGHVDRVPASHDELRIMSVEPRPIGHDEETIERLRPIPTPGPEIRHPWRAALVVGCALGFVALVLCGIVAWIVEALT